MRNDTILNIHTHTILIQGVRIPEPEKGKWINVAGHVALKEVTGDGAWN